MGCAAPGRQRVSVSVSAPGDLHDGDAGQQICPCCLEAPQGPVRFACGHSACASCAVELLRRLYFTCPVCGASIVETSDEALQRIQSFLAKQFDARASPMERAVRLILLGILQGELE